MFDEDFATGEKPTMTVVEAERRRADAERAHRKGFAAGGGAGAERSCPARRRRPGARRRRPGTARSRAHRYRDAVETEAVEVAVAVAAKLAPQLIAREPFAEISALATECFHQLVTTPHIVVRIGADIYETAKDRLEEIARARGFEGRLMVTPDTAMAPGDCRIEWADGGVTRDHAATLTAIDDVVGRYVAARTASVN